MRRRYLAKVIFEEVPTRVAIGVAALIGSAIFLQIFGFPYLLGTSPYWSHPHGDAAMTLMGWNYFIHDAWHWPLGLTKLTNPPEGVNILFFDTIPLIAIPCKLLVPVLGTHWNPYGLWHGAIYVLQAVFGVLLARRLGIRSLAGAIGVALLCTTMSMFLLRFYHEDLNGQFLLALLNYARSVPSTPARSLVAGWVACLVVSLLIQPYLTAMVATIAIAAHVRLAASHPRRVIASVSCVAVALAVAWFAVGYRFPVPTDAEAADFGVTSMNALSPFVPLPNTTSFASSVSATVVQDATGFQWEGQNFLGFGVLPLLFIAVTVGARTSLSLLRKHKALGVALLVLAIYSFGPCWYVGNHALVNLSSLAHALPNALRTFRATGRFFWVVAYALTFGSVVVVTRRFGRRGLVLVVTLAVVQLADSSATRRLIARDMADPWERYADWTTWQDVLPTYQHLVLYPSWYCWGAMDAGEPTMRAEREIEFMAAEDGLTTNHARTGRVLTDCSLGRVEPDAVKQLVLAPDTLYVFLQPAYDVAIVASIGEEHCTDFRGGWLCAHDRPTLPTELALHSR